MTSIDFFEIRPGEEKIIESLADYQVLLSEEPLNSSDAQIISIRTISKITRESLAKIPNCKLLITRTAGFDHIDLDACKKRNIRVESIPTYGEQTIAEHSVALLFSISRNIHTSYKNTLNNEFSQIRGFDLQGKTIGFIGTGKIGLMTAKLADLIGMKVIGFDPYKNDEFESIGEYKELDELLNESDIISIHCPLNKQTHHLINDETLSKTKKGVILINTARGGIIDSQAMLKKLDESHIRAVGLDVLEDEELIFEGKPTETQKKLLNHPNVLFTPHNAYNSDESINSIVLQTIEIIKNF